MTTSDKQGESKNEYILRKIIGARRLHRIGNSLAVVIPINFLAAYGERIDGSYWVTIDQDGSTLIIKPQTNADVIKFNDMVTINEEGKKE